MNSVPVPGSPGPYNTSEDIPLAVAAAEGLLTGASDADGNGAPTAVAGTVATAEGGSVVIVEDGSFTYTPATDFHGADAFQYTITDGEAAVNASVMVTVGA